MGMIQFDFTDDPHPVQPPWGIVPAWEQVTPVQEETQMSERTQESTVEELISLRLYTPGEVAKLFRVKRTTVVSWCHKPDKAKMLGAFKPAGGWRFRADVLDAYLRRLGVTAEEIAEVVRVQEDEDGGAEADGQRGEATA